MNRRQLRALLLVGMVLGAAIPVLAATFTNPVPQSGTVPYETNSGATVNVVGATNTSSGNPFPDDNTVEIETEQGNATFSSTGTVNSTVHVSNLTGTTTSVTDLNVTNAALTIDPEDKPALTVEGDTDRIEFRDPALDDGTVDFVYAGDSGTTTVTVRGLPADTYITARDADTDETLDISQSDGSGAVTLQNMPNSVHRVQLIQGSGSSPVLSDPQPDGNVSSQPTEFSVHVSDDDFPGDTVTLEWYYKGSQFDTTTTSSDGRQSVPAPTVDTGVSEWSVVATDDTGNQDVVNATVGIPGEISIRNESDPSQLVTETLTVTIYSGNESYIDEQTVSDGTVDMTGLPTTDFILQIDASGTDYTNRTRYYQTIVGNKSAYVLNTSVDPTVNTRFVLDDPTGEFGPNTVIYVQRALNQSGAREYRTVHADLFGVEGVTTQLEQNERYKIVIQNEDGTVQDLGPYRAEESEIATVRPGTPTIDLTDYEQGWAANATLTNQTLEFAYDDPNNETQQLTVWIHEKGDESNRLRPNTSYFSLGSASGSYSLTANESEKTWVVNFVIEFNDGSQITAQVEVSNRPDILPPMSQVWLTIIGVAIMLISGGVFSQLNAGVGGVVVALEGGILWWLGFLDATTSGASVVMAIFVAVLGHLYTSRGP